MKVLILTSKRRIEKYTDFSKIPGDWKLVFLDSVYEEEEAIQKGGDADFIVVDAVSPVSRRLIGQMPKLRLIHSEGAGFERIDLQAAREAGVYVCNNASLNSGAVAEQAILLMLALLRRFQEGDNLVRRGKQGQAKSSFILDGITELESCHVGIVGFGSIGKATAKRLLAFGSKVSYYGRHRLGAEEEKKFGVSYLPLSELAASCDIVSLHLPVTPETTGLIDREFLRRMKPSAVLVNTARGEIVDQAALADALESGTIAGAGLDTLSPEPATLENPLLRLSENCRYRVIFSPHIGGTTNGVFYRLHRNIWNNLFLSAEGKRPNNVVNGL
ncbi:GyaR protein [Caproiciproducens sp. NJN-50]|uniref:2-hydroxyacid dehydrogenase n=1 Tax=Acutalibacteraceae TaxID=3082771 RepID=UPI000FFE2239|nr:MULTISPECIES: 2-hydroxyacid dehydrogenase [Acutalibacteraceae]QAT49376.1 GyaR protein [Caproiciproducens sp. NJN-50]